MNNSKSQQTAFIFVQILSNHNGDETAKGSEVEKDLSCPINDTRVGSCLDVFQSSS